MRYLRFATLAAVLFAVFSSSVAGQGVDFQTQAGNQQSQIQQNADSKRPTPHVQAEPFHMPQYSLPKYNMPQYRTPGQEMPDYNPTGGQTQWFDEGTYRVNSTNVKGNPFYQHYVGNRNSRTDITEGVDAFNPHARVRTGASTAEMEQNRTPGMTPGGSYQAQVVHKPITASEGAYNKQDIAIPRSMTPGRMAATRPGPQKRQEPRYATVINPLTGLPVTGKVASPSQPVTVTVDDQSSTETPREHKQPRVIEAGVDENGAWKAKVIVPGRTSSAGQLAPIVTPHRRSVVPVSDEKPISPAQVKDQQPQYQQAQRPGLAPITYGRQAEIDLQRSSPGVSRASQPAPSMSLPTAAGQHRYGVTSPRPAYMNSMLGPDLFNPAPVTTPQAHGGNNARPVDPNGMLEEVDSFDRAPVTTPRSYGGSNARPVDPNGMLEEVDSFDRAPITTPRSYGGNNAQPVDPNGMLEEVDRFDRPPANELPQPRSYPVIDEPENTSEFEYPGSANQASPIRGVTTSQQTFNPIAGGYLQPLPDNPAITPVQPYRDPRSMED